MGKYGINVPKGVAVGSIGEVKKAIQDIFPNENEVILKNILNVCSKICHLVSPLVGT